jgi:hypothetical protein
LDNGGDCGLASWGVKARAKARVRCLACGGAIEPPLSRAGSIRCLGCREATRPLDAALVEPPRRRSPVELVSETLGRGLFR